MPAREPSARNVPNAICVLRLIGAVVLAWLAHRGSAHAFAWLFAALFLSDWIDGKLAILLRQRTTIGARLDSAADVAMYAALLFGLVRLEWSVVRAEWLWIAAAISSYVTAGAAGMLKFGRFPTYHTRSAKTSWLLVGIAVVALFADGPVWPLRVATGLVTLANLESLVITCVLPRWRVDVPSLYHALRDAPPG